MNKVRTIFRAAGAFFLVSLAFSGCDPKELAKVEKPDPQVFTPAQEPASLPDSVIAAPDTLPALPEKQPQPGPAKLPSPTELKTITPGQEAKRALTTDAMKAAGMPLAQFGEYMKSRIPYYRGKGELKFENDIVRITISKTDMQIHTPKGSLTFSMQ